MGSYELIEKVSLVLAVSEGVRTVEHVRWAFALVKRDIEQKIRSIMSNDLDKAAPVDALAARVLNICGGEDGETISVIAQRCRGKRKEDVVAVVARLAEAGRLEKIQKKWSGRVSERFKAVDKDKASRS